MCNPFFFHAFFGVVCIAQQIALELCSYMRKCCCFFSLFLRRREVLAGRWLEKSLDDDADDDDDLVFVDVRVPCCFVCVYPSYL